MHLHEQSVIIDMIIEREPAMGPTVTRAGRIVRKPEDIVDLRHSVELLVDPKKQLPKATTQTVESSPEQFQPNSQQEKMLQDMLNRCSLVTRCYQFLVYCGLFVVCLSLIHI